MKALRAIAALGAAIGVMSIGGAAVADERPTVVSIEPSSGPPGTVVRISGRFFTIRDRVFLGNIEQPLSERLPNRLTVTIAPGSRSGRFRVEGHYTVDSPMDFRVTEPGRPPLVSRFLPMQGSPGTEVVIIGQNFAPNANDNQVMIGDRPLTIRSGSITELRVIIPEGTQSGNILVRVRGAGEGLSAQPFTVLAPLVVSDFQPRRGGVNEVVTFTGAGFPLDPRQVRVLLSSRPCRITEVTSTTIKAVIPPGSLTGRFDVSTVDGRRTETQFIFTITTPPVISRIVPGAGPPGAVVVVQGAHFGEVVGDVTVTLGGRPASLTGIAPVNDRQVTFAVPEGATSGPVVVTVRDQGAATSPGQFTVLEPLTLADFSPRSGAPGSEVVLRGTGFIPSLRGQVVTLASRNCRVIAATTNELRVQIPPNAITGVFDVEIRGRASVHGQNPFQVVTPPTLNRFEPLAAAPGADVTIFGDNLGTSIGQVRVTLAGRPCAVRSVGLGQVIVQVPQGAVGGRFQVSVEGMGSVEASRDFIVLAPLSISSIQPTSATPGATVTIAGAGFSTSVRDNTVRLNGRSQRVLSAGPTQLQVVLGRDAATGRLAVSVRGRPETVESPVLTVEASIMVGDFSPRSGPVGSEVIIRGRGFEAANGVRVTIGGRTCRVVGVTAGELRVQIPPGATSAPLRVSVRGVGEAETRDAFTVASVQAMGISQMEILVMPGRVPGRIRLRGNGFGGDIRAVTVNVLGHQAQVAVCTPDIIEFIVPSSVSGNLGRVRVSVRGVGEAVSAGDLVLGPAQPPPPPVIRRPPPPPAVRR